MPFEPNKIKKEHVFGAAMKIKEGNIDLNPSTKYHVIIDGKAYTPMEIIRYAHEEIGYFGGHCAS